MRRRSRSRLCASQQACFFERSILKRSRSRAKVCKFNIVVVLGLAMRPKYLDAVEDKIGFGGGVCSENHLPRDAESFVAT